MPTWSTIVQPPTMHYYALAAALAALLAVRVYSVRRVRFDRYNALHERFKHLLADPSKMTYQESEDIQKVMQSYVSGRERAARRRRCERAVSGGHDSSWRP